MERRIFLAIVVSIAVLWSWAAIAPRIFPELARQPVPAAKKRPAVPAGSAPAANEPSAPPPAGEPVVPVVSQPVQASAAQLTVIETDQFRAAFRNRGAQLVSFQLQRYRNRRNGPVELVRARPEARTDFPFAIETADAAMNQRLNTALYQVEDNVRNGSGTLLYRYAGPDGVSVTKSFRFSSEFLFDFAVTLNPPLPFRVIIGPGIRSMDATEQETPGVVVGNGILQKEGDLEILPRDSGDRLRVYQNVDFLGIEDNYFMTVVRPSRSSSTLLRAIDTVKPDKSKQRELYAGITAAGGTVSGSAFFGPKETEVLDRYGLSEALQYGMFSLIARFLLEMLVWINQATHNYGWSIVVLTIIIKIVLYPLQHKSIVSMKKMQKVQPKMEAIKSRYKKSRTDPEQRQKMNVEMMKLYQQEGINPMSGCIPILLQLPILWGFYNLLSRAIELRGAPFMLWVRDLSEKDPTYVLPILMTATMFIQTYITPMTGDPAQRKIFLIMPIFFGYFFKEMPSGLVLYWLVQNILTIAQQMIMNRWWKDHPAELQTA